MRMAGREKGLTLTCCRALDTAFGTCDLESSSAVISTNLRAQCEFAHNNDNSMNNNNNNNNNNTTIYKACNMAKVTTSSLLVLWKQLVSIVRT